MDLAVNGEEHSVGHVTRVYGIPKHGDPVGQCTDVAEVELGVGWETGLDLVVLGGVVRADGRPHTGDRRAKVVRVVRAGFGEPKGKTRRVEKSLELVPGLKGR